MCYSFTTIKYSNVSVFCSLNTSNPNGKICTRTLYCSTLPLYKSVYLYTLIHFLITIFFIIHKNKKWTEYFRKHQAGAGTALCPPAIPPLQFRGQFPQSSPSLDISKDSCRSTRPAQLVYSTYGMNIRKFSRPTFSYSITIPHKDTWMISG